MAREDIWLSILLLLSVITVCTFQCQENLQTSQKVAGSNCSDRSSDILTTNMVDNITCNGSSHNCTQRDAGTSKVPPKTVEEFCIFMKIPEEKCACKISPKVCDMEDWLTYQRTKPDFDLAIVIVVTTSLVLGVVGNSAVLLSAFHGRDNLSKNQIVIALLALTDGVSSVLNFLDTSPLIWTNDKWTFGIPLCKLIFTGMMACSWLSSGFILIIALERFYGILYPLRELYTSKVMYGCVAGNLILVISLGIPMIQSSNVERGTCHNFAPESILIPYHWVIMIVFMIAPMSAVSYFYFRIIHYLHDSSCNLALLSREDIRLRRLKENRRTMKILLAIVVAFVVCVLPVKAIDLYVAYFKVNGVIDGLNRLLKRDLLVIYNISYPLHACVNPIIYTIIDPGFRKNLHKMFRLLQQYSRHFAEPTSSETVTTSF